MNTKSFRSLPLGSTFRFASETTLGAGTAIARGPWIKLTPRKYMHEDGGPEHTVGTVKAETVEVSPSPLPSTEAEVAAASNRTKMMALKRPAKRLATAALCAFLSLPAFATEPCKVNVNAATPAEIQLFARTGEVLSSRIIAGRPLDAEKLDAVKGVGEAWLAVNGPHVAFEGATTCTEKIKAPTPAAKAAPKVAAQSPKL